MIETIGDRLSLMEQEMKDAELKSKGKYKKKALAYLEYLHKQQKFLKTYYDLTFKGLKKLYNDAKRIEWNVEQKYNKALVIYNNSNKKESIRMKQFLAKRENAYKANQFMLEKLNDIKYLDLKEPKGLLYDFKKKHLNTIFKLLEEGKTNIEVAIYIEIAFAKMYHQESLK